MLSASGTDPDINGASLSVAPRAVSQEVFASLAATDGIPSGSPVGQIPVGKVFRLEPSGTAFTGTATLTLPVPTNAAKQKLYIGTWNETTKKWEKLGGTIDGDYISTNISHFSFFGVFGAGRSTVRLVNATSVDTTNIGNQVIYISGPNPPVDTQNGATFPAFQPLPQGGVELKQG